MLGRLRLNTFNHLTPSLQKKKHAQLLRKKKKFSFELSWPHMLQKQNSNILFFRVCEQTSTGEIFVPRQENWIFVMLLHQKVMNVSHEDHYTFSNLTQFFLLPKNFVAVLVQALTRFLKGIPKG